MSQTNWHVMVVTDLYTFLSGPQVQCIQTTFLQAGVQNDRFTNIVGPITSRVRNRILRRNIQVSQTPLSVPPELVLEVTWLILDAMQGALTGFDWSPQQIKAVQNARDVIEKQVQAGDFPITLPSDPAPIATVDSGGGSTVVQAGNRTLFFRQLRGL